MEAPMQIALGDRLRVAGRALRGLFKSHPPAHPRRVCWSFSPAVPNRRRLADHRSDQKATRDAVSERHYRSRIISSFSSCHLTQIPKTNFKNFCLWGPGRPGGEVFRNLNVGVVDPKLDDCAPLHKDLIGEAGTGSQVSYWDRPDCQPIATVHHRFAVAIYGNIVETHAGNS